MQNKRPIRRTPQHHQQPHDCDGNVYESISPPGSPTANHIRQHQQQLQQQHNNQQQQQRVCHMSEDPDNLMDRGIQSSLPSLISEPLGSRLVAGMNNAGHHKMPAQHNGK
jgi:hypothetical protein